MTAPDSSDVSPGIEPESPSGSSSGEVFPGPGRADESIVAVATPVPGAVRKKNWNQALVFFFMLVILAIIGEWSAGTFLWSYVAALMFVNYVVPWLGLPGIAEKLSVWPRRVICLLLVILPVLALVRASLENEALMAVAGARELARDKWKLQTLPSIFPAFVRLDQPQRFFVYSPGSGEVTARFGPHAEAVLTESLGHGLFMLDFDPRKTVFNGSSGGLLSAALTADGVAHERSMRVIEVTPHPRWFTSFPAAGIAATVSEETDELIVVHRDGRFQRIGVEDGPTDCALFAAGTRVAVCHKYQPVLSIVDVAEAKVIARHVLPRFQVRLATSPDEKVLAVAIDGAERGIQFLSLPEAKKMAFVPLPFAPDWIVFGRDSRELVATDRVGRKVHRLRAESAPEASSLLWTLEDKPIEVARPVITMCRAPGGSEIVFSATSTELNHEPIAANHFIEDSIHRLDLKDWKVTETYPTHRGGLDQDEPGTTAHGVSPMGIAALGDSLLIAFAGTNDVATVSPEGGATLDFSYIDEEPLAAPHGVADLGDGVWCVSSPVDSTIGLYNRDVEIQHLIRLGPDAEALENDNPTLLTQLRGERTFFEATRSGVSCQSCHLHTDTDHSEHSIGATELVGVLTVHGIAGTSPYLRDGSYPQLLALHSVVPDVYRGYQIEEEWDRAGALESYMNSLSPVTNWRSLEPHDADHLRRGVDAFVKADCIHCHVPPAMTNLGLHPTSVIFPEYGAIIDKESGVRNFLDVPQLRGVSLSPPYLHNGRAPTLEAIFQDHNSSARHGDTSGLSDDEFRALIYFLEQL